MSIAFAIAQKDIREVFHSKSTYIYVILMLIITFPYLEGLRSALSNAATIDPETSLEAASRAFLNAATSTLTLTLSTLFCTYLSAYAVVLDKARRTLESLLATPASLKQVWVGKTLAVSLPAVVVTVLVVVAAIVVFNAAVIMPRTGTIVLPGSMAAAVGFVLVPLLTLEIVGVVSAMQLIMSNPRLANLAFVAIFFGFYFLTVTNLSSSWNFSLIYLVAVVILAILNLALSRLLTKERVILSSKG